MPEEALSAPSLTRWGLPQAEAEVFAARLEAWRQTLPAEECWQRVMRELRRPGLPFELFRHLHATLFSGWDPSRGPAPVWIPDPQACGATHIGSLLRERGWASYEQLQAWSVAEPAAFWGLMIERLGIRFQTPPREILDLSAGAEHPRWLPGARLNIAASCFQAPPDSPAILWRSGGDTLQTVSYAQLRGQTNRVAHGLLALGLKPAAPIAIDMPMTPEAVAIYLGIIQSGLVAVSIADALAPEEIATRLRIAGAQAIFTQDLVLRAGKTLPLLEKIAAAQGPRAIVLPGAGAATDRTAFRPGDLEWAEFLGPDEDFTPLPGDPQQHTNILFSSGTTGTPKAIPWTQTTPLKAAIDGHLHMDLHPGQAIAWPTNLGWMMGPWLVYASLLNRGCMALFGDAPTGRPFCRFVQDARVNVLGVVPSLVKAWRAAGALEGLDWSALTCFASTGECSNADDYLYLMIQGGYKPVIEYCGGTEIGGGYLTGTLVQPAAPAAFSTPALGSAFVLRDEAGEPTRNGEVFLVPPALGLSQELLNRDHHEEYFAHTPPGPGGRPLRRHGDQIEALGGGFYRAHGRVDDTMNLGGIKVSSVEIERVLDLAPGIRRTAAIAVPPPGGGPSLLVIFAVPESSLEALTAEGRDALRALLQSTLKSNLNPLFRIHEVVWVEALPTTASNKVVRRALRADYHARAKPRT